MTRPALRGSLGLPGLRMQFACLGHRLSSQSSSGQRLAALLSGGLMHVVRVCGASAMVRQLQQPADAALWRT